MSDQYDGARAMSAEELKRRAEQQADGMRNAWPACEDGRLGEQQSMPNELWRKVEELGPLAQAALDVMPTHRAPFLDRLLKWFKA